MHSSRLQAAVKALLLMATGFFFYSRIANGTLFYYINQRFAIYTLLAVFVLIALGLSYRFDRPAADDHTHDHDHDETGHEHADHPAHNHAHNHALAHDHGAHEAHEHGQVSGHHHVHDHAHGLSWSGAFLVMLPIVLGLAVSPRPLGVSALDTREMNLGLPGAVRATQSKSAGDKNVLDWWTTFQSTSDISSLNGQAVHVTGFVYHDPHYSDGNFVVTRYVVTCCVADASVVGLVVRWPQAAALANDQWVDVNGVFEASQLANWHEPVVAAKSITKTTAPNQPYLYP